VRIRATSRLADHQHGRAISECGAWASNCAGLVPGIGRPIEALCGAPAGTSETTPDREEWIHLLCDLPYSLPLTTCPRAARPALRSRRYRSASEFAPTIDDVLRVEAGKLIRFDQVDVRCRDRVVGVSDRSTNRLGVFAPPEAGTGSRCGGLGVLAPIVAPLAGDELVCPPSRVAWLVEVGERFAVELRHLQLAIRGCTSQALLDRTLDPRHTTNASEVRPPDFAELSYAVVQIYFDQVGATRSGVP